MIGISITSVILFQRLWNSDFVTISNTIQQRKKFPNENNCSRNVMMNQYGGDEDDFTYEGSIDSDIKSGMETKKSN